MNSIEILQDQETFSPGLIDIAGKIEILDHALVNGQVNQAEHARHVLTLLGVKTSEFKTRLKGITIFEERQRR